MLNRLDPAWLAERLDVLTARRTVLLATIGGVVLLGLAGALLVPSLVPPNAFVGAGVGIVALALGVTAAHLIDAADLMVRGPRHVHAAGADLIAVLDPDPDPASVAELGEALLAAGGDPAAATRQAIGVSAASRRVTSTRAWGVALAEALAASDHRVVLADLTSRSGPGRAGVLEVVAEGRRLVDVVELHPRMNLARIGAGADHGAALQSLPGIFPRLPRDIEVLFVALPPLASPSVLGAAASLDRVVILVQTDTTSRVDLIASLDAVDAIGVRAEVLLLEPALPVPPVSPADTEQTATEPADAAPAKPTAPAEPTAPADAEPPPRPAAPGRPAPASTDRIAAQPAAPPASPEQRDAPASVDAGPGIGSVGGVADPGGRAGERSGQVPADPTPETRRPGDTTPQASSASPSEPPEPVEPVASAQVDEGESDADEEHDRALRVAAVLDVLEAESRDRDGQPPR